MVEWTWCHCWVPLQGAIVVCYAGGGEGDGQLWRSGQGAIVVCWGGWGSGRGAIAGCHCSVLWLSGRGAIAGCHCRVQL